MNRAIGGALLGGADGIGLLAWAFLAAGFGHGSYLPAALVAAPISSVVRFGAIVAPVLWAAIGYAVGRWEYLAQTGRGFAAVFVWPGFVLHLLAIVVAYALALRQLGAES